MANHKDYESTTQSSDICIDYFVFIFQCVLMFYYVRFVRLLNASNCFITTFSFNDFIHELFFLFKNACWYKYLVRSNRVFENVSMGSLIAYLTKCFMWILYSILLPIITFFLLFTVHFYDKDLSVMALLSLHVDSINIKQRFLGKFSNKYRTIPHVHMCFLIIIILHISDIISAFWRNRNKSRSRPRLLEQFVLFPLEPK